MSIRHLTYLSCDCCGNPSEAMVSAAESRRTSGYRRSGNLDICPFCRSHPEPCADWLKELLPTASRRTQESWEDRREMKS